MNKDKNIKDKPIKESFLTKLFKKKVKVDVKPDKPEQPIVIKKEKKEDAHPVFQPVDKEVLGNSGGLISRINEVNEKIDALAKINQDKMHKKFGLPGKINSQLKKLAEKNKVLILFFRINRNIEPIITDVKNGFVIVNNIPRNCSLDFVFLWKGKHPCLGIKEWDVQPIGTKDYYEAVKANRVADPMPTAIRMLEEMAKMEKGGMQMSPKVWVFIGLGVIALLWVLFGGGF